MTSSGPSPKLGDERFGTGRKAVAVEAWAAAAFILLLLGLAKHLAPFVPGWDSVLFTSVLAVQLYLPVIRLGRNGIDRASLGLTFRGLRLDLRDLLVVAIATGVPYALAVHAWQTEALGRTLVWAWPDGFIGRVATEVGIIALSEELFFRGYLQERFDRAYPGGLRVLGAWVGGGVLIATSVFALAHFVGDYRLTRLATFFPGLVFGWLRARRNSLVAPIGYHAFCNLLADVLASSHR